MDRHDRFLRLKEVLERLDSCHDVWRAADGPSARYLEGALRRDLGEFRRLCESMRNESSPSRMTALRR